MEALKFLLKLSITIIFLLITIFEMNYYLSIKHIPFDKLPTNNKYFEHILDLAWISLDCDGKKELKPLYIFNLFSPYNISPIMTSARLIQFRSIKNGSSSRFSMYWFLITSIWVSRSWTANDALNTILSESYFGYNKIGIENASKFYYSLNIDELHDEEIAVLLTIIKNQSYYNPYRHPNNVINRLKYIFKSKMDTNQLEEKYFSRMNKLAT